MGDANALAAIMRKMLAGEALSADELAVLQSVAASAPPVVEPLPPTPEPPATVVCEVEVSRAQLAAWSQLYGTQPRQLRRWIARGKQKNDPCPLDRPALMPAWIEKHISKIRGEMRDRVSSAASAAIAQARAVDPFHGAVEPPPPDSIPPTPPAPEALKSIDLAAVEGIEGQAVAFGRKLVSALVGNLEEAYKFASEDRIRTLHGRYERAVESLRKQELAAEIKAKRLGEMLSKAEVFSEITQALSVLKLMREHMVERIRAELPDLSPEILDRIAVAVTSVRENEDNILRNISAYKTPNDLQLALAS